MDASQLERLHYALNRDQDLRAISEYYAKLRYTYTALSVRGVVNGLTRVGKDVSYRSAREFIYTLVENGVGKGVRAKDGKISNIENMVLDTREIGEVVVGDSKNLRRYAAERKARGIESAAQTVKTAPKSLKVYPMRQSSSLSITLVINGKPVMMPLPDLEPEELAALIKRLKEAEDPR